MRLWKRRPLQKVFGRERPMVFEADPAKARSRAETEGRRRMAWAGKAGDGDAVVRGEDGPTIWASTTIRAERAGWSG